MIHLWSLSMVERFQSVINAYRCWSFRAKDTRRAARYWGHHTVFFSFSRVFFVFLGFFFLFFNGRWHPKLHHVLVEMEKGHLKDIDLPASLRRSYSLHDVIQVGRLLSSVASFRLAIYCRYACLTGSGAITQPIMHVAVNGDREVITRQAQLISCRKTWRLRVDILSQFSTTNFVSSILEKNKIKSSERATKSTSVPCQTKKRAIGSPVLCP